MFQRLSASKLPIAKECPGAFALEAHAVASGPWALRGTVIHDFIDRAFRESRDTALAAIEDDELRAFCARIPLHELEAHFGGTPETEVDFAYFPDEDGAERIDVQARDEFERQVPARLWIPGRIDAHRVIRHGNGYERVKGADWKTGFLRVAPPLRNLQLRCYALMLARAYSVERVEFAVIEIDEEGFPFVRNAVFEDLDIAAAATEIRAIAVAIEGARLAGRVGASAPRLRVGDHCEYCEALPSCPAFVGTAQALVPNAERTLEMQPAQLGELYKMAEALEIAVDRVKGAIRFQVERRGLKVPLPNGKELRAGLAASRTLSGKITLEVMRDKGMELAFLTAASVTFTGIEAACGDRAEEVLKEIEARGGITSKSYVRMRELKPKKET